MIIIILSYIILSYVIIIIIIIIIVFYLFILFPDLIFVDVHGTFSDHKSLWLEKDFLSRDFPPPVGN